MTGYFGVAIYHPKHSNNIGTLWRSCNSYGAAFLATVGSRYKTQSSDTKKSEYNIPLFHFQDIDDLINHLPYSCPLIGIELDSKSISLEKFCHPIRACYLLGAEDHGLPSEIRNKCHSMVEIPGANICLNVAVAGSIVIYDRCLKMKKC